LPGRIAPQRGVIVEILVAEDYTVNLLPQQIDLPVNNEARVARIGQHPVQRGDQTQAAICLAQEQHAPVAADLTPDETRLDFVAINAGKLEQLLRTTCRRCLVSF
jgi:hypothetical protein